MLPNVRLPLFFCLFVTVVFTISPTSPLFADSVQEPPGSDDEMVLIPGGLFGMGQGALPADAGGSYMDKPMHEVVLEPFFFDRCEVTNAQYLAFCQATKHRLPEFWGRKEYCSGSDFPQHPVVGVSYGDAQAFAAWAGKRLPTEAEWECAARGGLPGKDFPNGDELGPNEANFAPNGKAPVAVASFKANGYGCYDMAGNVTEWVADWYDRDAYSASPRQNPSGPAVGRFRVFRGGGWHSGKSCCRVHYRNALPANFVDFNLGFRCARSVSLTPAKAE